MSQSLFPVQLVRQLVAVAQTKLSGQALGVPGVHVPLPLHALVVSLPALQVAFPHAMVVGG